jgi:hypothetical protein
MGIVLEAVPAIILFLVSRHQKKIQNNSRSRPFGFLAVPTADHCPGGNPPSYGRVDGWARIG